MRSLRIVLMSGLFLGLLTGWLLRSMIVGLSNFVDAFNPLSETCKSFNNGFTRNTLFVLVNAVIFAVLFHSGVFAASVRGAEADKDVPDERRSDRWVDTREREGFSKGLRSPVEEQNELINEDLDELHARFEAFIAKVKGEIAQQLRQGVA